MQKYAAANGGSFALVELDLANLKSVRTCSDRLLARGDPFDVIIANAIVASADEVGGRYCEDCYVSEIVRMT